MEDWGKHHKLFHYSSSLNPNKWVVYLRMIHHPHIIMKIVRNIGQLDEEEILDAEGYLGYLENILSDALLALEKPGTVSVTIVGAPLEHLTIQRQTGNMPSGVYNIFGQFQPGTFKK